MRKLGIHDLVAMVKYAIKIWIIDPETLPFQKDFQIPQYCAIGTVANETLRRKQRGIEKNQSELP